MELGKDRMMYRILVTGSRDWEDRELFRFVLSAAAEPYLPDVTVVHGYCLAGADAMADEWARAHSLQPERHPADWDRHGKSAGPRRNGEMVRLGADICLAFIRDGSRGASGCAALAESAGIRTIRYRDSGVREYCSRCNYDRHACPGCGKPLPHGAEACLECLASAMLEG
jgi:SLOG family YspA-like protein